MDPTYQVNEHNSYIGGEAERGSLKSSYKQTKNRPLGSKKNLEQWALHETLAKDPAMVTYFNHVAQSKNNKGFLSLQSRKHGLASIKYFLEYLGLKIIPTAVGDLIAITRQQHRQDDFTIDDKLLSFASGRPTTSRAMYAAGVKGIFKANRCPLQASFNTTFTHSTRKISPGILKAIYDRLDQEHRAVIDLQAYAGERVAAICRKARLDQWEDYDDRYTLIHIKPNQTKARNEHICIIPKPLADWIRAYCKATDKTSPFPNHETLWRDITKLSVAEFSTRLTSHYLRKRFHTIAGKTAMPVNSWDYLMGDKQTHGHNAGTYTLEDYSDLVEEYDRYLAPHLSIANPQEPDEPRGPTFNETLRSLQRENGELREQLLALSKLLAKLTA